VIIYIDSKLVIEEYDASTEELDILKSFSVCYKYEYGTLTIPSQKCVLGEDNGLYLMSWIDSLWKFKVYDVRLSYSKMQVEVRLGEGLCWDFEPFPVKPTFPANTVEYTGIMKMN